VTRSPRSMAQRRMLENPHETVPMRSTAAKRNHGDKFFAENRF